jgi:hypothetical protein
MSTQMSIWFAISLAVGIISAFTAVTRRGGAKAIYVGIIESCLVMGIDRDSACLQVRAYVDETLANALPPPSKLIGRMFIRETNTSVPLTFGRVPAYVAPKTERSDWQERDVPVRPVIFRFDRESDLAVHPGQLVDVYIEERQRAPRC